MKNQTIEQMENVISEFYVSPEIKALLELTLNEYIVIGECPTKGEIRLDANFNEEDFNELVKKYK